MGGQRHKVGQARAGWEFRGGCSGGGGADREIAIDAVPPHHAAGGLDHPGLARRSGAGRGRGANFRHGLSETRLAPAGTLGAGRVRRAGAHHMGAVQCCLGRRANPAGGLRASSPLLRATSASATHLPCVLPMRLPLRASPARGATADCGVRAGLVAKMNISSVGADLVIGATANSLTNGSGDDYDRAHTNSLSSS